MNNKKRDLYFIIAGGALVLILLIVGLIFTANPSIRTIKSNSWLNQSEAITVALDFAGAEANLFVAAGSTVVEYRGSFKITDTGLYITDDSRRGDGSGEIFAASYILDGDSLLLSFSVSNNTGTATFTLAKSSQEAFDALMRSVA